MYPFELGKVYTFNTKAPSLLGAIIKNATLLSIIDHETAQMYENIDLKYRQVYPLLPEGTVDDPKACVYYRFRSESGTVVILSEQWIDENTIETISHITFRVTMTQASLQDMSRVRNLLSAAGYRSFEITQV